MRNISIVFIILFTLFINTPSKILASCTYKTNITSKHVDVIVSNDTDTVSNINIYISGAKITKWYAPSQSSWIWDDSGFSIGNNGWIIGTGDHTKDPYVVMWRNDTAILFSSPVNGATGQLLYKLPNGVYGVDLTENINSVESVSQVGVGEVDNYNCTYDGKFNNSVSTLIFAPGLGASWNLPDFISCGKDASGTWSLAPYAANVYSKVLESLSNAGWKTKPFYYDWRQNVSENSTLLSSFIDANTPSGEKANFVGHSMGGLIGRGYMQANSGGKLDKYYSVGTPHQGSALAYAPWEGGEVWTENLVEKIAIDLYLKHCGGIVSNNRETIQSLFPSVQNLLPTFPYLQDRTTNILKSISSMKITNNFISSNFIAPFWNVKVGTLSGDGQKTLNIIDVVNPSRLDIKLGNWIDGFPIKKEYSNEGDGTVLKTSSEIFGALQNDVITQTHRNLVTSTDGINKILSFLGSPEISGDDYTTETSAIVLVGYPGNFQVTNEKGEVVQSDKGMVVITNPTDSAYQIQFDPNDSKTTLIIDQVLSNGQIAYREYKYPQAPTEAKILEFDSKHASNNPIHEVKEYKKPHFPIFWHGFWKWWNKYNK